MIVSDSIRVDSTALVARTAVSADSVHPMTGDTAKTKLVKVERTPVEAVRPVEPVVAASEWVAPMEVEPHDTIIIPEALRPVVKPQFDCKFLLDGCYVWEREYPTEDWRDGDSLVGNNWERTIVPTDGKMAGDPLSFRMASDNYIGSILLVCFCVIVLLVAHAQQYLALSVKEFFTARQRENMFNDSTEGRVRGNFFFPIALCFSLGVICLDYQQVRWPDVFRDVPPYVILGVNVLGCLAGYGLRTLLYAFVNMVFFERDQNDKWMEAYGLLTISASMVIVPIALLVVFYELDFSDWKILFSVSVVIVEIFLIFKTYRVFFEGLLGVLRIILYLCALEFLPLLCMWKGMVWATQELTNLV